MIKQFNRSTGCEWVIHIKRTLDEGIEDEDEDVPDCIFIVPKAIVSTNQEAYIPQLVAIGPYHHRRVELFEMERYKLVEAERAQNFISRTEEPSRNRSSSSLADMVNHFSKKKTIHNGILRDMVMLENQIPPFVLREVNTYFQYENPDEALARMLIKDVIEREIEDSNEGKENQEETGCFKKAWKSIWGFLCFIIVVPIRFLNYTNTQIKSCQGCSNHTMATHQESRLLKPKSEITTVVSTAETVAAEIESESGLNGASLLIEQLLIPSATKLSGVGVKFIPTKGGLKTISYEDCLEPECSVFTRYVELTSGIPDTKEDVRILRDSGIVLNRLKSDEEAAN
ncbi:putative UPF0481 protein At3g02645 [Populus alba]|uniref:putative UPF0481 protein At3g02645 n=1 Tax=Populus alba TaxID=43335 RepID=UPI00158E0270|nr:putative UPF0481 protein At3g02645 [Populus alba]